ncbi:MAG TPA: hypothetical protein VHH34_17360 [Pseudonocardiaceae bacterium]|nr:hypothetical protein [Pseudonocardiaceae bacterium]
MAAALNVGVPEASTLGHRLAEVLAAHQQQIPAMDTPDPKESSAP